MDNVTFHDIETSSGIESYALIDNGNGNFISMTKATYEATLASELSNPSTPQAGE